MAKLVVGKRVLDIGYAQYPNPFLKDPIGVDVQVREKPRNYKKTYKVNLNKEKLPFKDNSFDTVIAGEVIEHVENPSFLLREINRVLEDKGKLIISTPHACYYWEIIRNLFFSSIKSIDVGEHLSNWNILDFERLLRKNGFEVKKKYGDVFTLPPPLRWKIPVQRFPKLSWVVIYEIIKERKADDRVYTRASKGSYKITDDVIKIDNN